MKRVLLTGATGFIGGELVRALTQLRDEYRVFAIERYVTGRTVAGAARPVETFFADLADFTGVRDAINQAQPDVVIHLAAESAVSYSYDHAAEVMRNNILSTVNLAEACKRYVPHLEKFIFAGTSEEYGNNEWDFQREWHIRRPNSPYAVSKVACEDYLTHLYRGHKFPTVIARPFNTYGRRSNFHFFVERTLSQMIAGDKVCRLGDPNTVRDFMFADDHVNGYLNLLDHPTEDVVGEVFNFCTGEGHKISDVAKMCADAVGWSGEIEWNTIPKRPEDINVLVGDFTKAARKLGWTPTVELRDGIAETIRRMKP